MRGAVASERVPPLKLLVALALVALPVLGQTTGVVTLAVGDYSQLSFVSPSYFAGLGLEKQVGPVELNASFLWSPGEKDRVRIVTPILAPTWNGTAQVTALLRLGPALVGGGGSASITTCGAYIADVTPPEKRAAWRPLSMPSPPASKPRTRGR